VIQSSSARPFDGRPLPPLPRAVRIGRRQIRVAREDLGREWLRPLEALLQLIAGKREAVAV
jgi:hypothetical protein